MNMILTIHITTISNIENYLGRGSDWTIDSLIDHNINILKYNTLAGSSYTKLPKRLDNPKEGLINIQNVNANECFK